MLKLETGLMEVSKVIGIGVSVPTAVFVPGDSLNICRLFSVEFVRCKMAIVLGVIVAFSKALLLSDKFSLLKGATGCDEYSWSLKSDIFDLTSGFVALLSFSGFIWSAISSALLRYLFA